VRKADPDLASSDGRRDADPDAEDEREEHPKDAALPASEEIDALETGDEGREGWVPA
jgi:hypothetical protein